MPRSQLAFLLALLGLPAALACAAAVHRERVDVAAAGGEIILGVEDNGPGVPQRDRARIWEPYVRLERDRRSSIAGTGIGLAVVKDLVLRHGGSVRVDNAATGGARFAVTFPHAVVAAD